MSIAKKKKEVEWYCTELDLSGYAKKELQEAIEHYISENKRRVYLEWEKHEYEKLEKMVKFGSMLLSYHVGDVIDSTDKKLLFELGTLKGITECFEHLLYEKGKQMRVEEKIHIASLSTKYFNQVIDALLMFKRITHTELCGLLNLKPSTLTEAMKKILETGMVQAVFAGKYKIYSLTDDGVRYARIKSRELKAQKEQMAGISTAAIWTSPFPERIGYESGFALCITNEIAVMPGDKIAVHQKNSDATQEFLVANIIAEKDKKGEEKKHLSVENLSNVNELNSKTTDTLDSVRDFAGVA